MRALVLGLCGLLLAGVAIVVTLASLNDAGGAQSAGPVPRLPAEADSPASAAVSEDASSGRVGFIGLPPEGAEPSTPERGELVLWLAGRSTIDGGPLNDLRVYADGRLIWRKEGDFRYGANSSTTGYLEQRLTPEGIERMRSEILATGLYVRDLRLKSSSFGLIWGETRVRRDDDQLVRVAWSYPGCCHDELPDTDATPEQERGLAQLNQLLRHPGPWLPASAWEDMTFSAYVPPTFAVCYGPNWGGTKSANPIPESRILASLPRSAGDVLRTKERVDHPDAASGVWVDAPEIHCWVVSTDEARVLAGSFDRAGYERDRQWVLEYEFNAPAPLNQVGIVFEPIFPDGEWGCSDCG